MSPHFTSDSDALPASGFTREEMINLLDLAQPKLSPEFIFQMTGIDSTPRSAEVITFKTGWDLSAEAKAEMEEQSAQMADPTSFDGALLSVQIEECGAAVLRKINQDVLDLIRPPMPLMLPS